eukprot:c4214_g1_i1.p2 GENE.c4214_g1_i1~~c4214_g1_i1.p2  ORF type:complete len:229 (-),score=69.40 c4214_g1_i1:1269-1955(-)
MNVVKEIQRINEREIKLGLAEKIDGSWHAHYKDSAYVFVGGIPYEFTEGDVLAVFSQYGEIVDINLVRDKDTGKSKGFAFIAYEDQRSTVLAVDNFNGIKLSGRVIRVDHCADYRQRKKRNATDDEIAALEEIERTKRMALIFTDSAPTPQTQAQQQTQTQTTTTQTHQSSNNDDEEHKKLKAEHKQLKARFLELDKKGDSLTENEKSERKQIKKRLKTLQDLKKDFN